MTGGSGAGTLAPAPPTKDGQLSARKLRTSSSRRARGVALLAVGLMAAGAARPAGALASTVSVSGTTLIYLAGDEEANSVTVVESTTGSLLVTDSVPVVAGHGCSVNPVNPNEATCTSAEAFTLVSASALDLEDALSVSGDLPAELDGGRGPDSISGGTSSDSLAGGPGRDVVSYSGRAVAVEISLDGLANDGAANEGDSVAEDVEDAEGGQGADVLTGDGADNALRGGPGDDTLEGRGGSDTLAGGRGDDRLLARDGGADAISCGDGADTAIADAADRIDEDCEAVDVPVEIVDDPAEPPPPSQPRGLEPPPAAQMSAAPPATATARAPARMLAPFPTVRIRGTFDSIGARIELLSVHAPLGAKVIVRCIGRRCPVLGSARARRSAASVAEVVARRSGLIRFPRLHRRLLAGTVIEVRVTRAGEIGKYTRFRIRGGKPPARIDRCVRPGSTRPMACPSE